MMFFYLSLSLSSWFCRYLIKSIHLGPFLVRINWNKGELMPVHVQNISWLQDLPCRISPEKFTYLGIQITKSHYSLFKDHHCCLNYSQIYSSGRPCQYITGQSQCYWNDFFTPSTVFISEHPRISSQISSFHEDFHFHFFFKKVDSVVHPFPWDYKTHRIGKKHLCKSKTVGGLALPNLEEWKHSYNRRLIH